MLPDRLVHDAPHISLWMQCWLLASQLVCMLSGLAAAVGMSWRHHRPASSSVMPCG